MRPPATAAAFASHITPKTPVCASRARLHFAVTAPDFAPSPPNFSRPRACEYLQESPHNFHASAALLSVRRVAAAETAQSDEIPAAGKIFSIKFLFSSKLNQIVAA
jgi:hypothetical protein